MTVFSARALIVPGLFLLGLLMTSCSNQGEGERCDIRNFNTDCQAGLSCVSFLGSNARNYQLCCPAPPAVSVVPACNAGSTSTDGGAAAEGSTSSDARAREGGDANITLDAPPDISSADTRPEVATPDAAPDITTADTRPEVFTPDASPDVATPDAPADGPAPDVPSPDAPPDALFDVTTDIGPIGDALDAADAADALD